MATGDKILLGAGVVAVGGTPIGLTRGGSIFTVEREIRNIEADGDRGPVKGRIEIDKEIPKLKVKGLELFTAADMIKWYPGLAVTAAIAPGVGKDVTGTLVIASGDYVDVTFTGATKDGKDCVITVEDAINLQNLEWGFEDKAEVVPEIEWTGTYDEAARTTPPWNVYFET